MPARVLSVGGAQADEAEQGERDSDDEHAEFGT